MFNPFNFIQFINERIEDCENTLIIGCGQGRHELELKGLKNCLGIDICSEKLNECKHKIPVLNMDVMDFIEDDIYMRSYDTITAFDFIEHLSKENAIRLINTLPRIARKQIILFIPIEKELKDTEENLFKLQENCIIENKDAGYHLSIWTEQEFKDLGYETFYSPNFHGSFGALIAIKKL